MISFLATISADSVANLVVPTFYVVCDPVMSVPLQPELDLGTGQCQKKALKALAMSLTR